MSRPKTILTDRDFRFVDFGNFFDGQRTHADEFGVYAQCVPGRQSDEVEKERRQARIATAATKAPIILAREIVERHIGELRRRGVVTVPPTNAGLVLALEQLTHDVASAILDARAVTGLPLREREHVSGEAGPGQAPQDARGEHLPGERERLRRAGGQGDVNVPDRPAGEGAGDGQRPGPRRGV